MKKQDFTVLKIADLHPFPDNPFRLVEDELLMELAESIKEFGVVTPIITRPKEDGNGYEVIAGQRRVRASQLAGIETIPAFVLPLDRDRAIITLVDSNIQRENILPSERAFAYKMKLEAMKHQAGRPSKENDSQLGNNFGKLSSEEMAEELGTSKNQIFRYIRLTNLIPEILDMVDEKKIAFNPAVELSYLKPSEQKEFLEAMDYAQASPSLSQAQRLKKLSQEGGCTLDAMCEVMNEIKKDELDHVTIKNEVLRKYFPKSYTPKQMQDTIIRLLEKWQRSKQRDMER